MPAAIAVATLVIGAAGAYMSYEAQQDAAAEAEKAGERQQKLNELQAQGEEEAAAKEAENIRRRALLLKKTQEATAAGSGLLLGTGTPDYILKETDRLAEMDVLQTLKEGKDRANLLRSGGAAALAEGKSRAKQYGNAATAGLISFGGSAVNTTYNMLQSPKKTTTTSTTPTYSYDLNASNLLG